MRLAGTDALLCELQVQGTLSKIAWQQQPGLQWVDSLEEDHRYETKTSAFDEIMIYHALATLTPNSRAARVWTRLRRRMSKLRPEKPLSL